MAEEISAAALAEMTLSRLYELARERDVKNPRKYKKTELVEMLLGAAPIPQDDEPGPSPAAASAESNGRPQEEPEGLASEAGEFESRNGANRRERERRPNQSAPRRQAKPVDEALAELSEQPASAGPQPHIPPPPPNAQDFTPPSRLSGESDYIEDEPATPARDAGFVDRGPRPLQRGDYPSSQIGGQRQGGHPNQQRGRYDERRQGGGQREGQRPQQREDRRNQGGGSPGGLSRDMEQAIMTKGVLEIIEDANYGFIRQRAFHLGEEDIYVSMSQIKKFGLRTGDVVEGYVRPPRDQERYQSLVKVDSVNGEPYVEEMRRINFDKLTPIYPNQRVLLETDAKELATRLIDLFAPIGRGTRGIIVAKPKAGKTVMLKKIAHAVATNHPDIELIALLIDERPEEVTDFERNVSGLVVSSTFDEKPENHIQVAELVIEYAKRRVEMGKDVFLLLDSLTRLARAYNLTCPPSGKTLSGGLDPNSLYKPKRFLGAARKIEHGGSLTILCSALVETGSRLDDIIFEEFKGTANMELHLSRELADKRIFPSVDIIKSGTRHEELLYNGEEMDVVWRLRKMVADMDDAERMNRLITRMMQTKSNIELLMLIQKATE